MAAAAEDLVITIAELAADSGVGRPIRGWGGGADSMIATATDGTGSVALLLERNETENFGEFVGGRLFEVWLVPLGDRRRLDELAEQLLYIADVPEVRYLATRIVPRQP